MIGFLLFSALPLLLYATPAYAADFQKGVDAYQSGDYATALKEWEPLAEQGYAHRFSRLYIIYQGGVTFRHYLNDFGQDGH